MNYCTKCSSLYSKPGTCNCYAGTPKPPKPFPPLGPPRDTWTISLSQEEMQKMREKGLLSYTPSTKSWHF